MAAGAIGFSHRHRVSAYSGHFPASSLSDETEETIGMGSLHPVTYPQNKPTTRDKNANTSLPTAIDHNVQKLFACMSIAYNSSAQLAAPQFKAYKGLRITVKEKMRLNNIVWREWHLQYVKRRKNLLRPKICNFVAQMDGSHISPTVVVLEGKYWKRSNEVVKNEYMKWRVFYKERMKHWKPDGGEISVDELLTRVGQQDHRTISSFVRNQNIRAHYSPPDLTQDDYKMDLSDSIFNTLQSVGFPHQTNRDLLGLESSDLMQPELIGLEPEIDFADIDSNEPFQELLADALHMDNLKYCSGQKRPVFADVLPTVEESLMPAPSSYPAFKRSRSSTLQESDSVEQLLGDLQNTNDAFGNSFTANNDNHALSLSKTIYNDIEPRQMPTSYQQTSPNELQHRNNQNSVPYQMNRNIVHSTSLKPHNSVQLQNPQNPFQHQTTHDSSQTQNIETLMQTNFNNITSSHGQLNTINSQSTSSTVLHVEGVTSPPPPPPYSANHNTFTNSSFDPTSQTGYYSAHSNSITSNFSTQEYNRGAKPRIATVLPVAPSFSSTDIGGTYTKQQRQASRISHNTQNDEAEFKKPEMPIKPKLEEKSSFLTQLLRKPLDKEAAEPANKTNHSIHPVYFPQFTPISYTPQVPSSYKSLSSKDSSKGARALGADNLSSPSAEEDKKEAPTAEQKRRQLIKTGFEALAGLVPTIATSTTSKTSKATMLSKTIDFIDELHNEEKTMQEEIDVLSNEIQALDLSIKQCQGMLPATGIPMLSQHKDHMERMLQSYIIEQTQKNWKFYVFSKLAVPLFDSFYTSVSTSSIEDMYRSTQAWLDQHCSLVTLRSEMMMSLRDVCSETSVLTDPTTFPQQSREAVMKSPASTSSPSVYRSPTEQISPSLYRSPTEQQQAANFYGQADEKQPISVQRPPTETLSHGVYQQSGELNSASVYQSSNLQRAPAAYSLYGKKTSARYRPPTK